MASAAQQLRNRISFEFGKPVRVTLESDGSEVDGRNGTEYRYFLRQHQIMWVPEEANQQIVRHGAAAGDELEIIKLRGPRGKATWEVIHIADEQPKQQQAAKPAARPAATGPLATQQEQLPAFPGEMPYSASMYTALCAAIRVAAAAEKFAAELGRPVAFETQDLRAIAATLFIHSTGGSR